tara:strand:+ start:598 stop:753 length:156 start_codon:yes stop_codon:yes gene_type:complete
MKKVQSNIIDIQIELLTISHKLTKEKNEQHKKMLKVKKSNLQYTLNKLKGF